MRFEVQQVLVQLMATAHARLFTLFNFVVIETRAILVMISPTEYVDSIRSRAHAFFTLALRFIAAVAGARSTRPLGQENLGGGHVHSIHSQSDTPHIPRFW